MMALLTFGIVVGVASAGWWFAGPQGPAAPEAEGDAGAEADAEGPSPEMLVPERDYYAHVRLIELKPTPPDGGSWDRRGGPDIAFRLYWNGTAIFTGARRPDRLIAEWDLLRLDLKDAILSGQVEVASAVNAPIVRVRPGGILTIEIWDEDVAFDDEAGKLDLPVQSLRRGINTFRPTETGVARIVLDMVPHDTPLPDLLQRASDR